MAAELYFGPYRLDLHAGELFNGGTRIRVQQHPLRLLQLLIDHQGTLVTREEIRSRLWPNGTIVDFEHSINSAINKLRVALGDIAEKPTYVETVARKGYRFLAEVRPVGERVEIPEQQTLSELPEGSEISHYRVQEMIASGGMSVVYKAVDVYLDRRVALKILVEPAPDQNALARFHNEARTLSALEHANICTVYEFGEHSGRPFMAMQLLDGETVKDRIAREGALDGQALIRAAVDIADGLDAAHRQGVVHRDIKPGNLFLTRSGQAKVLDFGIASLTVDANGNGYGSHPVVTSDAGSLPGTAAYMSPEQIRGGSIDSRTDVFSFGLVLYEMATGHHPFSGESVSCVPDAILNAQPVPPSRLNTDVAPEVEHTILKALEKDPEKRFATAAELRDAMDPMHRASQISVREEPNTAGPIKRNWIVAAIALLIAAGCIIQLWKLQARRNWARAAIPRVGQLAAAGKYAEGYTLASQILQHLPAEQKLTRLMPQLVDSLSVATTPTGAEVYLRLLGSPTAERVGVTPINHLAIARGEYIISIRKAGYTEFARTVSSAVERLTMSTKSPGDIRIEQTLRESATTPQAMAFIPGGAHRLVGWARITEATANLSDYFIDRFEVSNADFKKFIDAGGYDKRQLWGSHLAAIFKDKTGLPGPRGWLGGTYPVGKQSHPVTGVTWLEASAYCRFNGKELPTLFQWERSARADMQTPFGVVVPWGVLDPQDIARRANFESTGTAPVDSFEFGMSPFGVYNLAGNVAEWVANPYSDGFAIAGGGWSDPIYQFGNYWPRPAVYSADTLGFRCATTVGDTAQKGAMSFAFNSTAISYPVSTDREFKTSSAHYAYEKKPLNAKVLSTEDTESWRREAIAFDGFAGERATAFLYLPKSASPPYQVIHFLGGGSLWYGVPVTKAIEDGGSRIAPYIRDGRAVLVVVLKGFAGREPVGRYANLRPGSHERTEVVASWAVDMQRSIDYLESRSDIDKRSIAFMNHSTFQYGAIFAALNSRYSAVVLVGTGLFPELLQLPPEFSPILFAPHIRAPKLLLNGLYDDERTELTVQPLFELLREPKKRATFAGGHIPPIEIAVPVIKGFLDQTLGPVSRR